MANTHDYGERSLHMHYEKRGKIEIIPTVPVKTSEDLSLAYTPGVATPCLAIQKDPELSFCLTRRWNTCLVVTDGTAVLGLGNIGASASIPVMEGKSILFKEFAGVDAFPICVDTMDIDEIVRTVKLISPVFGGINLEDINSPRCIEIENRLKEELDIPVFHDDQHGTAIIVSAGIINAAKLAGKKIEDLEIVINGAGSAGMAIAKMLLNLNVKDIVLCDINGALCSKSEGLNWAQKEMLKVTNKNDQEGKLADVVKGKDVFIGVSAPKMMTKEMVSTMAEKSIVFAMANPTPEIFPDEAKEGGAFIVGTGRSDFPNQVNNVLAFPGIFRGALDVRASEINEEMKVAAAYAIAGIIKDEELTTEFVLPDAFDPRVGQEVSAAVAKAARETGVARI